MARHTPLKARVIHRVARTVHAPQVLAAPVHIATCLLKVLHQDGPTVRIVTAMLPRHILPALTTKLLMVMTSGSVMTATILSSSVTSVTTASSAHLQGNPIAIPPPAKTIATNPALVARYVLQGTAITAAFALPHQPAPQEAVSALAPEYVTPLPLFVARPSYTMQASTGV